MAAGRIVLSQYFPARDRNNHLVSGAKLYVYLNRTTTKATIYSDEAMTTTQANPVTANASGQFPAIWASDATTYTLSITGPDGESIGNPSVFNDYSVSTLANTESVALAEAASTAAQDYYADILALAGDYPDPAALATRAAKAQNGADFSTPLNGDSGATLVGFRGSNIAQRLSGEWSVFENLTKAQSDAVQAGIVGDDLTTPIQEMLSDSSIRSLIFPGGVYKVTGDAAATECLLVEYNMNLLGPAGQQKTRIIGYMTGNTTGAVMRVRMTGSGDVRNWTMRGLGMYPEPSVGGKDGLVIADDGLPMLTCTLDDLYLGRNPTNGGYAATLGYIWAHSVLNGSTLSGGVLAECGDANLFSKNLSFGDETFAYTFDLVEGVRNNTVRDSTIVNRGGVLRIIDGQEIRLLNNQCEHLAGSASTNAVEAMVWLQGSTRAITDTVIEDNNFGGGTNYKRSIYVDNARHTVISKNHFMAPGQDSVGGNADVYTTANAVDTIIKSDNSSVGNQFSLRQDRVNPIKVIDSGKGTTGSYRTDLSLQNGWTCAGFWKDENGLIRFRSAFSGGTTVAGDIMGTLPSGYRPAQQFDATRRNLLHTTSDFSTSSWSRSAVTVTAEQGDAPNGRNEYQLIAATATTATHMFRDIGTTLSTVDPLKVSFYVQRTSGSTSTTIRGLFDGPTGSASFTVNMSTGAVVITPSGGAAATIASTASGSGWRVVITYTPAATGAHYLRFTPKSTASVYDSYLGDPAVDNFLLWGPQVEVTGTATEYQAVYSSTLFSTQLFDVTVPVQTSGGAGTVTVSSVGVIKVASLPAANATLPPIQGNLVS